MCDARVDGRFPISLLSLKTTLFFNVNLYVTIFIILFIMYSIFDIYMHHNWIKFYEFSILGSHCLSLTLLNPQGYFTAAVVIMLLHD